VQVRAEDHPVEAGSGVGGAVLPSLRVPDRPLPLLEDEAPPRQEAEGGMMARPVALPDVLRVLGRKHAHTVLALLSERGTPVGFNTIRRKYAIAAKALIATLRDLARVGLAARDADGLYHPTERGESALRVLEALREAVC
jgi:DNA-binding HxlR family transcriptional regulator